MFLIFAFRMVPSRICTTRTEPGSEQQIDQSAWLHRRIQRCSPFQHDPRLDEPQRIDANAALQKIDKTERDFCLSSRRESDPPAAGACLRWQNRPRTDYPGNNEPEPVSDLHLAASPCRGLSGDAIAELRVSRRVWEAVRPRQNRDDEGENGPDSLAGGGFMADRPTRLGAAMRRAALFPPFCRDRLLARTAGDSEPGTQFLGLSSVSAPLAPAPSRRKHTVARLQGALRRCRPWSSRTGARLAATMVSAERPASS